MGLKKRKHSPAIGGSSDGVVGGGDLGGGVEAVEAPPASSVEGQMSPGAQRLMDLIDQCCSLDEIMRVLDLKNGGASDPFPSTPPGAYSDTALQAEGASASSILDEPSSPSSSLHPTATVVALEAVSAGLRCLWGLGLLSKEKLLELHGLLVPEGVCVMTSVDTFRLEVHLVCLIA